MQFRRLAGARLARDLWPVTDFLVVGLGGGSIVFLLTVVLLPRLHEKASVGAFLILCILVGETAGFAFGPAGERHPASRTTPTKAKTILCMYGLRSFGTEVFI